MVRGRRGRRTKSMINIASKRIDILFDLAEGEAKARNQHRANRYVELARKIGMRYNVRVPKRFRRRYCKHCNSYLLPSVTSRVRVRRKRLVIFCENCGGYLRVPFGRESIQKG